ncbi:MAG: DegV family protein [Lachnospiraceae bacterium]|nr:DegV family protein [Lachnospiraceae bacterium]MBQ9607082.1 DegV family protein [Lachnospiraceae bacterium]MBR1525001.1 DegV family protein [Lachnospiraceae bacterium]
MSIRIIADSCCEFPEGLKKELPCENVPLTLTVDDHEVIDDETFDQKSFLKLLAGCKGVPRSACPSPESYMEAYDCEEDWVFVVTLSSFLSGSYNSAVLAKELYEEEHKDKIEKGKRIYVFDSKSASGAEAQVAIKVNEYRKEGLSFDEIVERCEKFIAHMKTYFVLESLEVFRKNGRLSNTKAFAANVLNLKPICVGVGGVIESAGIQRGIKNALKKMVEVSLEGIKDTKDRILIINHCNCYERAAAVLADFISKAEFKATMILDTAGVSSLYASDGGIIVSF